MSFKELCTFEVRWCVSLTTLKTFFLILCLRALTIDGLARFVSVDVADSAQKVVLLESSLRMIDEGDDVEPTTFVPDCTWYKDIPCTCSHVKFDQEGSGLFKHGFERLWNLRSLQQMLTVQTVFLRGPDAMINKGPHFWHAAGFGLFKNSLDASFFIEQSYAIYFGGPCSEDPVCGFSRILGQLLNWLITTKQFSLFPWEASLDGWKETLDQLIHIDATSGWGDEVWDSLLDKSSHAEVFLYVVEQLAFYAMDYPVGGTSPRNGNAAEELDDILLRTGAYSHTCFAWERWPEASRNGLATSPLEVRDAFKIAQARAFDQRCPFHPVARLLIFAQAVRPLLPQPDHPPWPSSEGEARPLEGSQVWRLCDGGKPVHRRVGQAELHILAADVVQVENSTLLEFLWMAGSDDGCVMTGANFHNHGDSYYSFAHTLTASHLVQWNCSVHESNGKRTSQNEKESIHSSSVSFSGFLTVTACLLPPALASALLTSDAESAAALGSLEVKLVSSAPESWNPEPFRLCPVPKPAQRRFLSACTATLHGADYVHKILPYAVEDWINYHLLLGIDHFTLFDTDGSYEPYVKKFVEQGVLRYHGHFPRSVSPTFGLISAGLKERKEQRAMLLEPHAIETCIWENRHISDWVVVIHSFEEYLHSPDIVNAFGFFNLATALRMWAEELKQIGDSEKAIFEFFQEPMGAPSRPTDHASVFSAWPWKRGLDVANILKEKDGFREAQTHAQPFSFIADPLNILQSAVHFGQSRADGQNIVNLANTLLRMNHFVDFGSNATRCADELGGCNIRDDSMLWAEKEVIQMRT